MAESAHPTTQELLRIVAEPDSPEHRDWAWDTLAARLRDAEAALRLIASRYGVGRHDREVARAYFAAHPDREDSR